MWAIARFSRRRLSRRSPALAVALLTWMAVAAALPLAAPARAPKVVSHAVTFTVQNTNGSKLSCATDGATYQITVQTSDNATNANTNNAAATATFVYDAAAPTASVAFPSNNTRYNSSGWTGTLSGSSADATSSVISTTG